MDPLVALIGIFVVFAALLACAAGAQRRSVRIGAAVAAFLWSIMIFTAASIIHRFTYNAWYGGAANGMIEACIARLEAGDSDAVLRELRRFDEEYSPTYEYRAHFDELAKGVASRLDAVESTKPVEPTGTSRIP